jgi:Uma2 family endonuclease
MADPATKHATYEDVLNAPPHQVAEVIDGALHLSPRPAGPHSNVASVLGEELGPPFRRGRGGPGGWLILDEPELHLGRDILVPDIAGWRRERMAKVENVPYFTLAPDWLCEVASPSTEKTDRSRKLPIYATEGVKHVWIIEPARRTLEVFRLVGQDWLLLGVHKDDDRVRAEPFEAIELDLALLWMDLA